MVLFRLLPVILLVSLLVGCRRRDPVPPRVRSAGPTTAQAPAAADTFRARSLNRPSQSGTPHNRSEPTFFARARGNTCFPGFPDPISAGLSHATAISDTSAGPRGPNAAFTHGASTGPLRPAFHTSLGGYHFYLQNSSKAIEAPRKKPNAPTI